MENTKAGERERIALPLEVYTLERKPEFLQSNAVDANDYKAAVKAVRRLGLDAERIPHTKPAGVRES